MWRQGIPAPHKKGEPKMATQTIYADIETLLFTNGDYAQILEGFWQGRTAHEIADDMGLDSAFVARVMDDFTALGY